MGDGPRPQAGLTARGSDRPAGQTNQGLNSHLGSRTRCTGDWHGYIHTILQQAGGRTPRPKRIGGGFLSSRVKFLPSTTIDEGEEILGLLWASEEEIFAIPIPPSKGYYVSLYVLVYCCSEIYHFVSFLYFLMTIL